MKTNFLIITSYFIMVIVHYFIFTKTAACCESLFLRFYMFLTALYFFSITALTICKRLYPEYLGFAFMGIMMVKLAMMFLVMNKLHLSEIPNYKLHFITAYLFSLAIITVYGVSLLQKDEKNH